MKKRTSRVGCVLLAVAVIGGLLAEPARAEIIWSTGFEASEGYSTTWTGSAGGQAAGNINDQPVGGADTWTAQYPAAATEVITTADKFAGDQAFSVSYAYRWPRITLPLYTLDKYVSVMYKPSDTTPTGTQAWVDGNRQGFSVRTGGCGVVFKKDVGGALTIYANPYHGSVQADAYLTPIGSFEMEKWYKLTLRPYNPESGNSRLEIFVFDAVTGDQVAYLADGDIRYRYSDFHFNTVKFGNQYSSGSPGNWGNGYYDDLDVSTTIPEPSTLVFLGMVLMGGVRRKH